jgi:MerR family transcriptional regulator, light-induced transcriptional regulator
MSEQSIDRDCGSLESSGDGAGSERGRRGGLRSRNLAGRVLRRARLDSGSGGLRPAAAMHPATTLERLVEDRIIPQLVEASDASRRGRVAARRRRSVAPTAEHVEELAQLSIAADASLADAWVAALAERGMARDSLYLEVLAPAARQLGVWWSDDRCSFVDVTVGLWRLQQIIQRLAGTDLGEASDSRRRLLLLPEPGEQHTFGLIMLAGFFRRDGWCVFEGPLESRTQIESLVAREDFGVVGLSIGSEARVDALQQTVRAVRAKSKNAAVGIMVGGTPFIGRPDLVSAVGADCTAANAQRAVAEANRLFAAQAARQ